MSGRKATRFRKDDHAAAGVVGEVAAVAVIVVLAGGLAYAIETEPPEPVYSMDLIGWLECGLGGWGTGDEKLILRHLGGEKLNRDNTRILVSIDGVQYKFPDVGGGLAPDLNNDGVPDDLTTVAGGLVNKTSNVGGLVGGLGGQLPEGSTGAQSAVADALAAGGLLGDFVDGEDWALTTGERWIAQFNLTKASEVEFSILTSPEANVDVLHSEAKIVDSRCITTGVCTSAPPIAASTPLTIDSTGFSGGTDGTTAVTPVNVPAGENRVMIISIADDDLKITDTVASIDLDGIPAIKLGRVWEAEGASTTNSDQGIEMWYLVNPPVGPGTLTMVWPSTVDAWVAGIMVYTGVDQVLPVGNHGGSKGSAYNIRQPIETTSDNALIVGALVHDEFGGTLDPIAPVVEAYDAGGGDDIQSAGGSMTGGLAGLHTWTYKASNVPSNPEERDWAAYAVELRPALVASGGGPIGSCLPAVVIPPEPCVPLANPMALDTAKVVDSSTVPVPISSIAIPYTVPDGDGRLLAVTFHASDHKKQDVPLGMRLNTESLTLAASAQVEKAAAADALSQVWYLKSPPVGPGVLTVEWQKVLPQWGDWVITVRTYANIDAVTPVGATTGYTGSDYSMPGSITTNYVDSRIVGAITHEHGAAVLYPLGLVSEDLEARVGSVTAAVGSLEVSGAAAHDFNFLATNVPVLATAREWAVALMELHGAGLPADCTTPTQIIDPIHRIDFDDMGAGEILDEILTNRGLTVGLEGINPRFSGQNTALVFDSTNPTGGDVDLGTPNQDFGGNGIGIGGKNGAPFQNNKSQGGILILAEDLVDSNGDGLIDDPDDEGGGGQLCFDFTSMPGGTVRVMEITLIDTEETSPDAYVMLYGPTGKQVAQFSGQNIGDNGLYTMSLGSTPGVASLCVVLPGSGAIDDLVVSTS